MLQTIACLDASNAFLHAGMKDEVRVKLDLDTLKLLQEVDSGGFQRVDKALQGYKKLTATVERRGA